MDAIKIVLGGAIFFQLTVIADKLDEISIRLVSVDTSLHEVIRTIGYDQSGPIGSKIIYQLEKILMAIYEISK